MYAEGENSGGSPDRIVGGVDHMLIVEGQVQAFDYRCCVIDLHDSFPAVAGQPAVADQDTEPAGGKIAASLRRDVIDGAGEAKRIVRAMPTITL